MANPNLSPQGAYVYEILVDNQVVYVGKGRGKRFMAHRQIAARFNGPSCRGKVSGFQKRLAAALRENRSVSSQIVADGMTDEEAFALEERLIGERFGVLWNEAPGGIGFLYENAADVDAMRERHHAAVTESWESPERHRIAAALAKARWSDPDARKRQKTKLRDVWADPDLRARHSQMFKERHEDPALRESLRARANARWVRADEREKQAERSRKMQLDRSARRRSNLLAALLSFGC